LQIENTLETEQISNNLFAEFEEEMNISEFIPPLPTTAQISARQKAENEV
jgi:hypothetical protein